MPIKQVVCCDKCDKVIKDPTTDLQEAGGFAFVGNVHVVISSSFDGVGGGIVGNNLSIEDDDMGESYQVVERKSYYCRECVVEVLFGKEYELKWKQPTVRDLDQTTIPPGFK